jgi:hypothetical protein
MMSSKNVLLRSYAVSPAMAGLTSGGWRGSRVQGAVLLGRLGQLLLLPLAAVPPLITGCMRRERSNGQAADRDVDRDRAELLLLLSTNRCPHMRNVDSRSTVRALRDEECDGRLSREIRR